jgi:IrrE N-terminal-like domain
MTWEFATRSSRKGIERIFVFDGLKHLIHYHSDLIKVLGLLNAHRANVEYELPDGSVLPEPLAFSLAGYAILANFHETRRAPMTIHDMLGPKAQADVMAAFRGAVCFVLLHELGHIELGHLRFSEVRSERGHLSLQEPELLNAYQEAELEADAFAMNLIPAEML